MNLMGSNGTFCLWDVLFGLIHDVLVKCKNDGSMSESQLVE